jgi:aspartate/methionine/tyrosine aminotransferase
VRPCRYRDYVPERGLCRRREKPERDRPLAPNKTPKYLGFAMSFIIYIEARIPCDRQMMPKLSARGVRATAPGLPYWGVHAANLDSPDFVSMAIAENKINFETIREKLASCRAIPSDTGSYSNFIGRPRMRQAFAAAMSHTLFRGRLKVDPDQICISAGCGSVIENLVLCLCDINDGIILPTPTYAALYNDIQTIPGFRIIDCPTDSHGFRLTPDALRAAFDQGVREGGARSASRHGPHAAIYNTPPSSFACFRPALRPPGFPPRALLLIHPNNPLGTVYSAEELTTALAFCESRGLHLICDEIYANS